MFFSESDGFSGAFSQVVKLCAFGFSASQRPDVNNTGAVQRKDSLNAFVIHDSADCECLVDASAFAGDDGAGEYLDSLFVALDDSTMYVDGVSDFEMRNLVLQAFTFDRI